MPVVDKCSAQMNGCRNDEMYVSKKKPEIKKTDKKKKGGGIGTRNRTMPRITTRSRVDKNNVPHLNCRIHREWEFKEVIVASARGGMLALKC